MWPGVFIVSNSRLLSSRQTVSPYPAGRPLVTIRPLKNFREPRGPSDCLFGNARQRDWLLGQFGTSRARQIARYIEFVQEGIHGPGVWDGLRGQVFLGSDAFVQAMQDELEAAAKHTQREIPRLQRRALAKSLDYYRDTFEDTKTGMAAAYATGDYTLQAIADAFGVHYSTVSRAVSGN